MFVVSASPIPRIDKVQPVYPPRWLIPCIGGVPARLVTFAWTALRQRPDLIAGFHLLLNGLVAALIARLLNARAMYFSVGGPMEVLEGGIHAENRLFGKMQTPDPVVERQLIRAVGKFDFVITMGTRAARFFRTHGIEAPIHIVPGGIDGERFSAAAAFRTADLIFVGRLAQIKRVDLFLHAVQLVARECPGVQAVIVGDGPLRESLFDLRRRLGLDACVTFLGHRSDVEQCLGQAKVFVLTSDSEGLALALMEAMMCGLPAVVSNVGDLADLVRHGVNGYLVSDRSPQAFAKPIIELLQDPDRLARFSAAARTAAEGFDVGAAAHRWDLILSC